MEQYKTLLKTILSKGSIKKPAREGIRYIWLCRVPQMRFNLVDGFPLLTTKKMPPKLIAHELIWFLRGDTNIKYLLDNNIHIWDKDAYRHFCNKFPDVVPFKTIEQFLADVKDVVKYGDDYVSGDLGELYGAQWRNWDNKGIDQIKKAIDMLKRNPDGRRIIVSAWNPSEVDNMALPPCHCLFQFNCRELSLKERIKLSGTDFSEQDLDIHAMEIEESLDNQKTPKHYLDVALTQRSCDTFLGVPFNIASYSLLLEIVAKTCNMIAGEFIWNGNDVHIYSDHEEAVNLQLQNEPMPLCKVIISERVKDLNDISEITIDDIKFENYVSHKKIEANLSVGK